MRWARIPFEGKMYLNAVMIIDYKHKAYLIEKGDIFILHQ